MIPNILLVMFEYAAPNDNDEPLLTLATMLILAVSPAASTAVFDETAVGAGVPVIKKPLSSKCFAAVFNAAG